MFTSVLGYKDGLGRQLATTSYLTVKVAQGDGSPLSASIGSLFSGAFVLWLTAIVLIILLAILSLRLFRSRLNNKKSVIKEKEDLLGFGGMPPTFQPVDPVEMIKR